MSAEDLAPLPALPDRARSVRWGYLLVRLLLVVMLLVIAAVLPSGRGVPERYRYREGDIVRERVVAPYDFRVEKDETTLRREQAQAAASIPPVFAVDTRASSEMLNRFATFQEKALAVVLDPDLQPAERTARIRTLGVPLSEESAEALGASGRANRALRELGTWLHEIHDAGVVAEKRNGQILGYASVTVRDGETESPRPASLLFDRREALLLIEERGRAAFPGDPRSVHLVTELAAPFIQPNVIYDRAETEWRRVQAQGAVQATIGFVQKDELIVDANQRLSRDALLKLRSLRNLEAARRGRTEFLYPPVARMLLMLLFIVVFATYLRLELPAVYRNNAMLAMFALLTAVVLALAEVQVGILGLSEFTVPLALAPLVVGSLLEKRPALTFTLILTVVATAVSELRAPFVPVAVMGGVTAVYSVSRLRHRWHFARAFLTIALANLAAILAWDLARVASAQVVARDAMWGGLNAFLAVAFAFLLLPAVEHLFGLTSDITLLELSDLNRPLLKQLQLAAHGTYHHSMVVGSLAEAAAEAIGANSLLARVMAYYHDIGKIARPEYYAENELGRKSPHEKLTPSMSALIVKRHITEGLEMARRHRLPKAVQDVITEHHGTMVMAFFYHKALEFDPTVRREDFSAPGPKPRSKETAILMLADGVEGASRALLEPTPSRVRGLVARIIDERVQQGQLDECGLTLQELARIRAAFFPVLTAIFHVRTPYPDEPKRRPAPMPISVASPLEGSRVAPSLRALVRIALSLEARRPGDIGIVLAGDGTLRELNRLYRSVDRATDVLSFRYLERGREVDGDVIVSLERMDEQARRYRVSRGHELARLIIHGALHLAGLDHHARVERMAMRRREAQALHLAAPHIRTLGTLLDPRGRLPVSARQKTRTRIKASTLKRRRSRKLRSRRS